MSTLDDATELLGELDLIDPPVRAFTDPGEALSNRPCVLLTPPATDYVNRVRTWQVKLLAADEGRGLGTWEELEDLEAAVVTVLPVEASSPGTYALSTDKTPIPCHVLTVRTSV